MVMRIPEANSVPRLSSQPAEGDTVDIMARLVLGTIDGKTTIGDISAACGLEINLAKRIIVELVHNGLVHVDGFEPDPPKSANPAAETDSTDVNGAISGLEADVDGIFCLPSETNYYNLLSAEPDATRGDLRSRYFGLSKRLHPDRAAAKGSPALREKMNVVFRRLTEAYDTLSDPKLRDEYDKSISDQIAIQLMERQLKSAIKAKSPPVPPDSRTTNAPRRAASSNPAKQSSRSPRRSSSGAPKRSSSGAPKRSSSGAPKRSSSGAPRRSSSGAPKRSSSGAPRRSSGASSPLESVAPLSPEQQERRKRWKRERAGKALADIYQRASAPPPPENLVRKRLSEADIAIEQERFQDAINLLKDVLAIEPDHKKAMELTEAAKKGHLQIHVQGLVRKARLEQRRGNTTAAQKGYEEALSIDSGNVESRHLLASLLLEGKQELTRALKLSKEVIAMGGQRARYFATLGEIYLLAKEPNKAHEVFEKAIAMEPDNKEYKKQLKACKKQ